MLFFIFNNNITNNSCCLIFLSLYKIIAMFGSTTLAKSFASLLYTYVDSHFLLLLRNIHKATGFLFSFCSFLCVLLLNPLFSQPNGNETHRYPVVLFSPFVPSLCFVAVSVSVFLSYIGCSASLFF
ncbi:hypothetical protein ACB092_05G278300 [Castanea dentata]